MPAPRQKRTLQERAQNARTAALPDVKRLVGLAARARREPAVCPVRWLRALHRWTWTDVRRRFTTPNGRWKPIEADGIELFNLASVPVTRYRYRGNTIPNPWTLLNRRYAAATVESPVR